MDAYLENSSSLYKGISYPFGSHTQESIGQKTMVETHYHGNIEILYCLSGKLKIFLNGQSYSFEKGDMVIINSMELHSVMAESKTKNRYFVIQFDPQLLYTSSRSIFEARYVLPFIMTTSTHQKVFTGNELRGTIVPKLLKEIRNEDDNKKYGFELAIRTHIGIIFLWILRSWNQKGLDLNIDSGLNQNTTELLQKVFEYIDNNYSEPISIDDMAKLCGMSYSYFSRIFKKITHKNFTSYVNFIRVAKAENILTTTDLTVTDIALSVGFTTTSYFIKQFKIYKNITPKQYRQNFINLNSSD